MYLPDHTRSTGFMRCGAHFDWSFFENPERGEVKFTFLGKIRIPATFRLLAVNALSTAFSPKSEKSHNQPTRNIKKIECFH